MPLGKKQSKVTVLLSGGIDSTACVGFYLEQGFVAKGLFIDYGQLAVERERSAARAIAKHYRIPLSCLRWLGLQKKDAGFIQARNAFLLIGALMELTNDTRLLAIGIHSESRKARLA